MSDSLDPIVLNFIYALLGGAMTLGFMWTGCKILNHLVNFRIGEELAKGNMAVGLMVMGIFVGVGIAMGLVIGMGLS